MNHLFRLIWSRTQESLVPVPEGLTARPGGRRQMRRARRIIRKTLSPGAAAALIALFGLAPMALALPTGGKVAAGNANIAQGASTTTITQQSSRAILDWRSFSIGSGETVTFVQPSASAVALNRVTGSDASAIYGHLNANGQVFLVNPNGIYFAPGAQVNVGGIVASTLGVDGADFMAGKPLQFSGDSTAGVVNDGSVTAAEGGYVAFIGRHVTNDGAIATPGGTTALGAGGAVDLTLAGNSLLSFHVSADALDAEVRNGGAIRADDGRVVLSARARDALMKTVVNNTGVIEARGVRKTAGGAIQLLGGGSGAVAVKGTMDASSAKGMGGTVTVTGAHVTAGGTARILATGATGGGTIAFGGGWHGAGGDGTQTAMVAQGAVLDASATGLGDGGTVTVWSGLAQPDGQTLSFGSLLAKGGPQGGDGGRIETSGHVLDVSGSHVDASAPGGAAGEWLLDPYDLTVSSSAASSINSSLGTGTSVTLKTTASGTSGPGSANAAGTGDITIDSALSWGTAATLTLDAYHSIVLDAPISVTGNGALALHFNDGGSGGGYRVNAPVNLTSSSSFSTQDGNAAAISYTIITSLGNAGDAASVPSTMTLQGVTASDLGGHYVLGANIDASATATWNPDGFGGYYGFDPIGDGSGGATFTGTFDGLGHTVSNLTTRAHLAFAASLFGYTSNSSIRNIGMVGGSVTGIRYAGGLVGYAIGGTIDNAYATGTVSTTSSNDSAGGLVGVNSGTISNAYATGSVSGSTNTGGLVGENTGTISNAYATGNVVGGSDVGGLIGLDFGSGAKITNAYATGTVSGGSDVGGLLGYMYGGSVSDVYATGHVSGSADVGGLVGQRDSSSGTITNGYWDTDSSGTATGIGATTSGATTSGATGLTGAQMMQQSSFTGFDFTSPVWVIYNGHTAPLLNAFLTPLTVTAADQTQPYTGGTFTLLDPSYSVSGAPTSGHLFGLGNPYDGATSIGSYSPDLWSDQQGYRITIASGTLQITLSASSLNSVARFAQNNAITWLPVVPSTRGLSGMPPPQVPNLTIEGGGVNHKGKG